MEQSSLIRKMKPYELATLAARMCFGMCMKSPARAIAAAERLLHEAQVAIECACAEEQVKDLEREPPVDWADAVKKITGQKRRDRAVTRFLEYIEHEMPEEKQCVDQYMRDGFPEHEMFAYHAAFQEWLKEPKRKKGKQGRRISEHDGRLRIGSRRLLPRKPPKRV